MTKNSIVICPDSPILCCNAKSAGYVRRMEAEKKIQFARISRPSKYMINKYGSADPTRPIMPVEEETYDDAPLFGNDDYFDYNVAKVS